MRVIFLLIGSLLFSSLSFADDQVLKDKLNKLKQLQERVAKECVNNPKAKDYSVKIEGKTFKCPELITVTDQLRKELAQDMEKHKAKCEEENKKAAHTVLAKEAATIAQKSVSCEPSPDQQQCLSKFACGVLTVTVPVTAIASLVTKSPAVKDCAAQAKGIPGCIANVMRGIFDSIWSALNLIWDVGKWAVTSTAKWMGIIKESEAKTSEKAMMAQQASPGFLKSFAANPIETMKKMAKDLYASIEDAAINHYGCEKWSGAPFVSSCLQPMTTWKCGTCQQKSQVFCGIAGYATGEIGTAFLTGGLLSGGKIALKGAVRLGSGPSQNVANFMSKTFPKASSEVAEAAGKVKALASTGLTAAQQKLFASWNAISESKVTKAIANAASKSGVSAVTKTALKPIAVYLNAMDKAFMAGMNGVDNLAAKSAKAQAGAKLADEAMGVSQSNGITIESSSVGAKTVSVKAPEATVKSQNVSQVGKSEAQVSKNSSSSQKTSEVADEAGDIAKYRQDPEYMELFKGPQMYDDHHKELTMVIRALEESQPKLTKAEIRRKIQETLNSCSL